VGAYKALVSIYQIICISIQRPWCSYYGDNYKCHWLRVVHAVVVQYVCVCVCVCVCVYEWFMPEISYYK
jgi:hypothetical protein